jgi:hypothetical protein
MKKRIFPILLTLMITGMISVPAMAQIDTHNVRTYKTAGRQIVDPDLGCTFGTFVKIRTLASWTEPTPGYTAQAHFRGVAYVSAGGPCSAHSYEFTLNSSTTTSAGTITGNWDVYRDGGLLCSACTGQATGLNQAAGPNFYDVLVDDPVYGPAAWNYSGYIGGRDDF